MNTISLGIFILEISVCVIAILLIRLVFGRLIGPKMCRLLWVVLIVRCLLPFSWSINIPANISLVYDKRNEITNYEFQIADFSDEIDSALKQGRADHDDESVIRDSELVIHPVAEQGRGDEEKFVIRNSELVISPMPEQGRGAEEKFVIRNSELVIPPLPSVRGLNGWVVILVLWGTGSVLFTVVVIWRNRSFARRTARNPGKIPDWLQTLFLETARQLKLRRTPRLVVSKNVESPCVMGVLRPRILIPKQLLGAGEGGSETMRHVLLHELAHLKQGDIWFSWCWTIALAVHWYNPLLWWACRKITHDCEAACDAKVLESLPQSQRPVYGHSLLEILNRLQPTTLPVPGMSAIAEKTTNLERRLIMITNYKNRTFAQTLLGVMVLLGLCAISLTTFTVSAEPQSEPGGEVSDTQTMQSSSETSYEKNKAELEKLLEKRKLLLQRLLADEQEVEATFEGKNQGSITTDQWLDAVRRNAESKMEVFDLQLEFVDKDESNNVASCIDALRMMPDFLTWYDEQLVLLEKEREAAQTAQVEAQIRNQTYLFKARKENIEKKFAAAKKRIAEKIIAEAGLNPELLASASEQAPVISSLTQPNTPEAKADLENLLHLHDQLRKTKSEITQLKSEVDKVAQEYVKLHAEAYQQRDDDTSEKSFEERNEIFTAKANEITTDTAKKNDSLAKNQSRLELKRDELENEIQYQESIMRLKTQYGQSQPAVRGQVSQPMPRQIVSDDQLDTGDVVSVQVSDFVPKTPYILRRLDEVSLDVSGTPDSLPINGVYTISWEGVINLGAEYGEVEAQGKTVKQFKEELQKHLKKQLKNPVVAASITQMSSDGSFEKKLMVSTDGNLNLGVYGKVPVRGLTIPQCREAIESHLEKQFDSCIVLVELVSKGTTKINQVVPGVQKAVQFLSLATRDEYEKALAMGTDLLRQKISVDRLKTVFDDIHAENGKLERFDIVRVEWGAGGSEKSMTRIRVAATFESGTVIPFLITVDPNNKIAGFFRLDESGAGQGGVTTPDDPVKQAWQAFLQVDYAAAETHFRQAVALNPENANAWQGLGWSLFKQGKHREGEGAFQKCLELEPENAAALNGLGWIAFAAEEHDAAIDWWNKALAVDPEATAAMNGLVQVYELRGDKENAEKYREQMRNVK